MKLKTALIAMAALMGGMQVNAKVVENPLINCDEHGRLATAIMEYKLKGAPKEKMQTAMKRTGETSPQYEIQANIGMKTIDKAYEIDPPKSTADYKKFAQDFGIKEAESCKKLTGIEVPDDYQE